MNPLTILLLIAGIVLLIVGAESMVRGASRLAIALGISPLIVGLTVVAFSTGSPELAVGIQSGLVNEADIALGNVVGSNIINVLVVLGVSAVIIPLTVHIQLVRLDVPIMIGASVLTLLFCLDGQISPLEGALLGVGMLLYVALTVLMGRKQSMQAAADYVREFSSPKKLSPKALLLDLGYVALGLVLLIIGARWLVDGAVEIARLLGISELIIGLTVVALGTSLPEVVTSIVAAARGERDIAVGNVVGSNIFNILAVLGLSAVVAPDGIRVSPIALAFDLPFMVLVAVVCLPIFFRRFRVERAEGAFFVLLYLAYTAYLLLSATQFPELRTFTSVFWGANALAVVILIVLSVRQLRSRNLAGENAPAD